jgi:hypothetical protein
MWDTTDRLGVSARLRNGDSAMPLKTDYRIKRRTKRLRGNKPLSGYAFDLSIRVNRDGSYFVDDQNNPDNPMPFNNRDEMLDMLLPELERHENEHFGHE